MLIDFSTLQPALAFSVVMLSCYLVGSMPTAYIVGRARGFDIRERGSGNVGATNVMRTMGKPIGISVLIIDLVKGILAVSLVAVTFVNNWPWHMKTIHVKMLAGIFAMLGHLYPVWLDFKGGKGVATASGFMLALAPGTVLIAMGVFFLTVVSFKIMSLGSIAAALSLPVAFFAFNDLSGDLDLFIFILIVVAFVVLKHRQNIKRILSNEEERISSFNKLK